MQTLRYTLSRDESPLPLDPGTAACIGAFDGFHLGHQALLRHTRRLGARLAVVTFEPHPAFVLAPDRAPPRLQTDPQRERVCAALGVDDLVLLPFDVGVAALDPEGFVRRFLTGGLRPHALAVGDDFRFGRGRAGGIDQLATMCRAAQINFETIAQVSTAQGTRISSTTIRRLVCEGQVGQASEMLDRWFAVEGIVRRGAARGRTLGFRTANVATENSLVPRAGVYASVLRIVDPTSSLHGRSFASVANVGTNPTFTDERVAIAGIEVHALDVDLGDALYELRVEVGFVARLRDEKKFSDRLELEAAIRQDITNARPLLDAAAIARAPRPADAVPGATQ